MHENKTREKTRVLFHKEIKKGDFEVFGDGVGLVHTAFMRNVRYDGVKQQ